jgi:hypothetical protein
MACSSTLIRPYCRSLIIAGYRKLQFGAFNWPLISTVALLVEYESEIGVDYHRAADTPRWSKGSSWGTEFFPPIMTGDGRGKGKRTRLVSRALSIIIVKNAETDRIMKPSRLSEFCKLATCAFDAIGNLK